MAQFEEVIFEVDEDLCTACETCVDICWEVFRMDGDTAKAYDTPRNEDELSRATTAKEACPPGAISIKSSQQT